MPKKTLPKWRSKHKTNLGKLINQLNIDIRKVYDAPSINYVHLGTLKTQLQLQYILEVKNWRTNSRILWLQAVYRNIKFFYAKIKQRHIFNQIIYIQDDHEKSHTKAKNIHIENYFKRYLKVMGLISMPIFWMVFPRQSLMT